MITIWRLKKWVENEGGSRLIYYHEYGDLMVVVIKVSRNKSDVWLLSMRPW